MSECVIVALPTEEHWVNKISSERMAHMTLIYLGELSEDVDTANIAEFVQHATSMFRPFYAQVERRGVLGKDNADVLFFYKQELSHVEEFRATLLQNDQIKTAYDSVEQYPSWTPHVTLGYPDAPARKPPEPSGYSPSGELGRRDYIEFDRIAIWFGDFDGPEFRLEEERSLMTQNEEALEFLAHYGVKGMKWGVRRDRGSSGSSSKGQANASDASSKPKKPIKRQENLSRYSDDKLASKISEKKGLDALSDAELSKLTKRMQLEQSYRELSAKRPMEKSKAEKFLTGAKILGQSANQLTEFVNSPAGKKLAEFAKKKAAKK